MQVICRTKFETAKQIQKRAKCSVLCMTVTDLLNDEKSDTAQLRSVTTMWSEKGHCYATQFEM